MALASRMSAWIALATVVIVGTLVLMARACRRPGGQLAQAIHDADNRYKLYMAAFPLEEEPPRQGLRRAPVGRCPPPYRSHISDLLRTRRTGSSLSGDFLPRMVEAWR